MVVRMLVSLAALAFVIAALIFIPAGTLDYWQAWLFLACYFSASLIVSLWLARHDPALLERRMRGGPFAEGERSQKIIMTMTSIAFVALLVVPGLDRHYGWSHMPNTIPIVGNILLLAGWMGIFVVFRANTYAAATIGVTSGQTVISTGPYRLVRHPMYAAALLMLFGIPLSLGSWWGVLAMVALVPALAWRLLDEEQVLVRDLNDYAEYRRKVRWRVIPFLW